MKLLDVCAFGLTGSMIPYSFFLFHEFGLTSLTNVQRQRDMKKYNKKLHDSSPVFSWKTKKEPILNGIGSMDRQGIEPWTTRLRVACSTS